jgi:hypothetical protein
VLSARACYQWGGSSGTGCNCLFSFILFTFIGILLGVLPPALFSFLLSIQGEIHIHQNTKTLGSSYHL